MWRGNNLGVRKDEDVGRLNALLLYAGGCNEYFVTDTVLNSFSGPQYGDKTLTLRGCRFLLLYRLPIPAIRCPLRLERNKMDLRVIT